MSNKKVDVAGMKPPAGEGAGHSKSGPEAAEGGVDTAESDPAAAVNSLKNADSNQAGEGEQVRGPSGNSD